MILTNVNKEIVFKKKESTFKEIPEQYLDSSKILNDTGWSINYCLNSGLKETIYKYKKWFNDEMIISVFDDEICNQKLG